MRFEFVCPKCGSPLRRISSIKGWLEIEQTCTNPKCSYKSFYVQAVKVEALVEA